MTEKRAAIWLLGIAGKYKWNIVLLVLLQAIANGGAVCYALVMKQMVDAAVGKEEEIFFACLIAFGLLMLFLMLLRMVLRQLEEATKSGMENRLKERLLNQLLRKDYGQVNSVHSEEWMNRMTSDTAVCAGGMTDILPGFMGMLVRMSGALVLMFVLQPRLAYILIPGGVIFLLITLILKKYLKGYHKKVQEKDGAVRVYLQERISSMLILRTFGAEKHAINGANQKFSEHKEARMRKALISNFANTGFSFAINGMYLIGIGYCGYGILHGVVSYGTLTAMMQLIGQLQAPLAGISGFVPKFYAMIASAERLMEAEDYKEANTDVIESREEAQEFYDNAIEEIICNKVSFDYKKENDSYPVLQEVSMSVKKGDFVAMTGTSGCGKSTLLKLLMGVYEPKDGSIDIVTKDREKQPVGMYRRLFSYVPQGNFLMSGTIREVITFDKEDDRGSSVAMEEAIRLACGEFVFELPEGPETMLGEKGAGLSEGQMQRIAIARALYADTPILILDEATSALDSETESRLLNHLKQLTDKTVLIVTHRTEAMKLCNRRFHFETEGILTEHREVAEIE